MLTIENESRTILLRVWNDCHNMKLYSLETSKTFCFQTFLILLLMCGYVLGFKWSFAGTAIQPGV